MRLKSASPVTHIVAGSWHAFIPAWASPLAVSCFRSLGFEKLVNEKAPKRYDKAGAKERQVASRSWKRQGTDSPLDPLEKYLDFGLKGPFSDF